MAAKSLSRMDINFEDKTTPGQSDMGWVRHVLTQPFPPNDTNLFTGKGCARCNGFEMMPSPVSVCQGKWKIIKQIHHTPTSVLVIGTTSVSYTHLDVYKRQTHNNTLFENSWWRSYTPSFTRSFINMNLQNKPKKINILYARKLKFSRLRWQNVARLF